MNNSKRKALEAKGWKVGSTEEFLSIKARIPRKLKKRYKKEGLWKSYLDARNGIVGYPVQEIIPFKSDITEEDLWELVRSISRD